MNSEAEAVRRALIGDRVPLRVALQALNLTQRTIAKWRKHKGLSALRLDGEFYLSIPELQTILSEQVKRPRTPVPRPRGRPRGSKNKPKAVKLIRRKLEVQP